jgi:hypothetical protein
MRRAVIATGMWLSALGLVGCAASPPRASSIEAPLASFPVERDAPAPRPIVVGRSVRPTKQVIPVPRTHVSGRVRSNQARPTPRRAWFQLVPDHPAAPGAR